MNDDAPSSNVVDFETRGVPNALQMTDDIRAERTADLLTNLDILRQRVVAGRVGVVLYVYMDADELDLYCGAHNPGNVGRTAQRGMCVVLSEYVAKVLAQHT